MTRNISGKNCNSTSINFGASGQENGGFGRIFGFLTESKAESYNGENKWGTPQHNLQDSTSDHQSTWDFRFKNTKGLFGLQDGTFPCNKVEIASDMDVKMAVTVSTELLNEQDQRH